MTADQLEKKLKKLVDGIPGVTVIREGDEICLRDGQGLTNKGKPIRYPMSGERMSVVTMTIADLRRAAGDTTG